VSDQTEHAILDRERAVGVDDDRETNNKANCPSTTR